MKKALIAASIVGLLSTNVQADVVGVYIGGQVWDNEAEGTLGDGSSLVDFNLADEQQTSFSLAVEHPLPFIPNAKIATTSLDTQGSTVLTKDFVFDDETFKKGVKATANFDISYNDYIFYYELFDNDLLTFDLGLTVRDFDGDVVVSATTGADGKPLKATQKDTISVSQMVPMLYASTIIGLPMTGLNLFAEANFLSIDDHTLYDYQAGLSYELVDNLAVDVNVTFGYRSVSLELEDLSDLYTDIEFSGAFAGLVVHF